MGVLTSSDLRMAEFMSLYGRCIAVKKLSDNSSKWFPKWFESYVRFHRFNTKESVEKIPVADALMAEMWLTALARTTRHATPEQA